jgi:NMD protein affecting ribosome stability and mRNA decay
MKPARPSTTSAHRHRRRFGHAQTDATFETRDRSGKPHQPMYCRQCGVTYQDGRWQWSPRPEGAVGAQCPACRRIQERTPAGIVTLRGARVPALKDDIVQLARHKERAEKPEHPLNRIMAIRETRDGLAIDTTDIHLPRRIGQAVRRAYRGRLATKFKEDAYFVRIDWVSPD